MSCRHHHHHQDNTFVKSIQVGKKVPPITINAYLPEKKDFAELSLLENITEKKWTVLFFYPADFTFVCPTELADLAAYYTELKDLGVTVISLSVDTKYAHLAWRDSEPLLKDVMYPMGEDPAGKVAQLFGIYNEETGKSLRGTIIISPEGVLAGQEVSIDNVGRNAAELLRKMQAHVYLYANPNQVCPAKWEKGNKTLTPSPSLVGNVASVLK